MNTQQIEQYIKLHLPEFVEDYNQFTGNPLNIPQETILTALIKAIAEKAKQVNPIYYAVPFDKEDLREFLKEAKVMDFASHMDKKRKYSLKGWFLSKVFGLKTKSSTNKKVLFLILLAITSFLEEKIEYEP